MPYSNRNIHDDLSWQQCSPNHVHQGELYAKSRYVLAYDPELEDMAVVKMDRSKTKPQVDPIREIHIAKYMALRKQLRAIEARDSLMWTVPTHAPKDNPRY